MDVKFSFDSAASGLCSISDGGVSLDYSSCRSPALNTYTCTSRGVGACSFTSEGSFAVTLVVFGASGCADTVAFRILVKKDFVFFIPNSFSPNDDGKNDTFAPVGSSLGDFEMIIFDPWEDEVFWGGSMNPWIGFINGNNKPAPDGVYTYRINLKESKFEKQMVTGGVLLIR